jgi:hypothetical protein
VEERLNKYFTKFPYGSRGHTDPVYKEIIEWMKKYGIVEE